jgi:hypothetical protein
VARFLKPAAAQEERPVKDAPDLASVLERIASDPAIRRELLWLRAKEKNDEETVKDLEEVEPGLRERMAVLVAEFVARGNRLDTPSEQRDAYGRLQDERFDHFAALFGLAGD